MKTIAATCTKNPTNVTIVIIIYAWIYLSHTCIGAVDINCTCSINMLESAFALSWNNFTAHLSKFY